jgi:hypothetical protein
MDMEKELGFYSSFNFVPERYEAPSKLRHDITSNGFEVGVHDLYHDGKLYKSKKLFRKRAPQINSFLKEWNSVGFRSGSMHNKLDWMHDLDMEYDSSTFDTDPFEPQSEGIETIFPFWVLNNSGKGGYVELPCTLPQDFTLFVLMKEEGIDIWKKKLDWIAEHGGMALLNTHPDYMNFEERNSRTEEYPVEYYVELLKYIKSKYNANYWLALPKDIARFYKKNINLADGSSRKSIRQDKKIWIDLDNSPHVPFFKPIARELKKQGWSVVITARDCSQTCGLADNSGMSYKKIGRHFGKNKILKILGLLVRSFQMVPFILKERPKLAISHGSRAQILISKLFRIKSINIFDYEHTQGLLFIHPDYSLSPEVITPTESERKEYHFLSYPGIKEDVYVPEFKPDHSILKELNIDAHKLIVTIRPPATQAHYHNPEAEELLIAVINYIGQDKNVCMVLMPRYKKQVDFIKKTWPELFRNKQIIIPEQVIDGLNLMWHSDLVVSGGGTMNREAAALGVPVYSIFKGQMGAVDLFLSKTGKLVFLENVEDVKSKMKIAKRERKLEDKLNKRETLLHIVNNITSVLKEI